MQELKERPARRSAPPARRRHRRRRPRARAWAAAGWAVLAAASAALVAWTVAAPHPRPDASAAGTAAGPRAGARDPAVVNGRRQPPPVRVPRAATGRYAAVPGTDPPPRRRGFVVQYMVEVERGLPFAPERFAAEVHRVLNDPRGWGRGGRLRFQRVAGGPVRFRVALSSPALTDRMCRPLDTRGQVSCHARGRAVLNARRWAQGAAPYRGDVAAYREYLVNHEVGHALGRGHRGCPAPGRRAPVMVQQTLSLYGCRANPWPYPRG
ncbi:DUF3152 domain-containing protein [Actinomadura sp. 21ATH]|uniref:DUF3152 domain-containing protein n=1 Tax=Actinomadura sp. 21ATH TaxID=1735444 RepID=UPI0035C0D06E